MTPKLALLIGTLAALLWLLRTTRTKIAGAFGLTLIEIVEAVFWGYTVYLLVSIPLSLDRLNEWSAFAGLLIFHRPISGAQVIGLLVGTLMALFRFFEWPAGEEVARRPDERIRGSDLKPLPAEPAPEEDPKGFIRKLLQRVFR